jgi:hypothetical protein
MPTPKAGTEMLESQPVRPKRPTHPFWDRTNKIEFSIGGAAAAWDMTKTCKNLATPAGKEYNLPVSSCGGAVAFTIGEQAAAWSSAYVLHRTHHHKLERIPELFLIETNIQGAISSTVHSNDAGGQ